MHCLWDLLHARKGMNVLEPAERMKTIPLLSLLDFAYSSLQIHVCNPMNQLRQNYFKNTSRHPEAKQPGKTNNKSGNLPRYASVSLVLSCMLMRLTPIVTFLAFDFCLSVLNGRGCKGWAGLMSPCFVRKKCKESKTIEHIEKQHKTVTEPSKKFDFKQQVMINLDPEIIRCFLVALRVSLPFPK